MKNKNIIISLLFTLLILSSCSSKKDDNSAGNNVNNVTVNSTKGNTPIVAKQPTVSYDKKTEELKIGNDVTINPGLPKEFPDGLKIFGETKTYINSNVPNYTFFVLDKNTDIKEVSKYYTDVLVKLGYVNKIKDVKNISNLDFGIKNENFIPADKRTPENLNKLFKSGKITNTTDIEHEYKSSINVKINVQTPDNIVKGIGLEGVFVEIFY